MRTSFELHFRGVEAALVEPDRIATAVQFSLDRHAEVYHAIRDRDPARARAATEALLASHLDRSGLRDPGRTNGRDGFAGGCDGGSTATPALG